MTPPGRPVSPTFANAANVPNEHGPKWPNVPSAPAGNASRARMPAPRILWLRPNRAHPLFRGLVEAALERQRASKLFDVEEVEDGGVPTVTSTIPVGA